MFLDILTVNSKYHQINFLFRSIRARYFKTAFNSAGLDTLSEKKAAESRTTNHKRRGKSDDKWSMMIELERVVVPGIEPKH